MLCDLHINDRSVAHSADTVVAVGVVIEISRSKHTNHSRPQDNQDPFPGKHDRYSCDVREYRYDTEDESRHCSKHADCDCITLHGTC